MLSWLIKKDEKVEESYKDRLSKVEKRMTRLEAEILDVATAQDIIRNKVLRKIQKPRDEEETEETDNFKGIPKAKGNFTKIGL